MEQITIHTLSAKAGDAGISTKLLAVLIGVSRTTLYKYTTEEWDVPPALYDRISMLHQRITDALSEGTLPAEVPTVEAMIRERLHLRSEN